jgi:hypothetical protein
VIDVQAAQLARDGGAPLALELGEALAHARARGVDLEALARLGVDDGQAADGGQLGLARVADLDGQHRVTCGEGAERARPARVLTEVGDDGDEAGLARDAPHAAQRVGQRVRLVDAVRRDALAQDAAQRDDPGARPARRQQARAPGAEGHHRHAPGPAHGQVAEHERHALGDVGLQPLGGAEGHRRRDVEHDPRRQRALGHVQAHVRLACARGRGRVDLAHVVADHVRAQLRQLGAGAHTRGAAVARQGAGRVARDDEVERVDQRRRHATRPLAGGRRSEDRVAHAAATRRWERLTWSASGSVTSASTRSSRSSALTPSLSAS